MKINALVLNNNVFKFLTGTSLLLFLGIIFDNIAVASTLNRQENNIYDLEKLSNFSLKFNDDIYNQLEKEILNQKADFSEYIDLIDNSSNQKEYTLRAELNILVQSQTNSEENLWNSFLNTLSQLEFESFSVNSSPLVNIPVLPQVNYRNIYKDVYDFDINLANSPSTTTLSRRVPKTTIKNKSFQNNNKYFYSYFQENKRAKSSLFSNQSNNINNTNSSLPTDSSSLVSDRPSPNLASLINSVLPPRNLATLTSSPLIGLSLVTNKSPLAFIRNSIDNINEQNYAYGNDDDSQVVSGVEPVYLPSTDIEIYQFNNFDVASVLDSYQKSEYQKSIDKNINKDKKKVEKQRKKMYKKLLKLQKQREKARQKKLKQYSKTRKKELTQAMKQQKKLQQRRQKQLSY